METLEFIIYKMHEMADELPPAFRDRLAHLLVELRLYLLENS